MLPYQTHYLENTRQIAALSDFYGITAPDYRQWYEKQLDARRQIAAETVNTITMISISMSESSVRFLILRPPAVRSTTSRLRPSRRRSPRS